MLDVLRNSAQGTAGKIIVGLIVITFVLFGAESIISIAGNSAPATVNGDKVSEQDYQRLLSSRQQELARQFGAEAAAQIANSQFLKDEIIESLVSQKIQSQLSKELGFDASEDQIIKTFASIEAFQVDGKFDQDQYQGLLAQNGFTHQTFVAAQIEQTAVAQLQSGIVDSSFVVERAVSNYAKLDAEQRTVRYKEFNAADFEDQVVLADEDIQNYYDENQDDFLSEEMVKVNYITVSVNSVMKDVVVTDEEIQRAYDDYVKSVAAQEKREISHILFAESDDANEKAESALERLNNGESFADLAKELSDDPGSAEFGGSLGVLLPDVYVDSFYDAAKSLSSVGDISGIVKTQYGLHIIKLDALDTETPLSLDEKRDDLVAELKERKARDDMITVQSQLSDEAFSTDVLAEVADSFQVDVQSSGWLTRTNNTGLFADSSVIEAAFSSKVIDQGLISDVVRMANGDLVALQKVEHAPEAVKAFDDVKDEVVAALTAVKSGELMTAEINRVVDAKVAGDDWTLADSITRDNRDVPAAVVSTVFALPSVGELPVFGKTEGTNSAYVVSLDQVTRSDPSEDVLASAEGFADQFSRNAQYQMMFNVARENADVEIRK